jgi:hypothetical protein
MGGFPRPALTRFDVSSDSNTGYTWNPSARYDWAVGKLVGGDGPSLTNVSTRRNKCHE